MRECLGREGKGRRRQQKGGRGRNALTKEEVFPDSDQPPLPSLKTLLGFGALCSGDVREPDHRIACSAGTSTDASSSSRGRKATGHLADQFEHPANSAEKWGF